MKDYRARIIDRVSILEIELKDTEIDSLNKKVNANINKGIHPLDALDIIFFHLKNKYKK